ncbi:SAM-dependent methyltransferase [alpha proteobacterium BAL199]|jgi:23S rRNA (uracil1939-C5)-methyltransferase|nr:SAM-dependent methyltransferase [alpha proteobacterium BAL199]
MRPPRRRGSGRPTPIRKGKVPANADPIELTIDLVGGRGDGVGRADVKLGWETKERSVFVPFTLPGERVLARAEIDRGEGVAASPLELIEISPDRVEPPCPHFMTCGGCALQHWATDPYAAWKADQVRSHLRRFGLGETVIDAPVLSPPGTRRRATLSVRRLRGGAVLGFHERQGNRIIDISECSVLEPALQAVLPAFREAFGTRLAEGAEADLSLTLLDTGVDALLVLPEAPDLAAREAWAELAETLDLARLSLRRSGEGHDRTEPLAARRPTMIRFGGIDVRPPAGSFLQATRAGETAIRDIVMSAAEGQGWRLDLFCGVGTLSLPLVDGAPVTAVDGDVQAIRALRAAADAAALGDRLTTEARDLFDRPFEGDEFKGFDVVVFDPPRSGAKEQAEALAASSVPVVVAVSCNPASFARDARILIDGGYRLDKLTPIDQFLWSPHIELAAVFRR